MNIEKIGEFISKRRKECKLIKFMLLTKLYQDGRMEKVCQKLKHFIY